MAYADEGGSGGGGGYNVAKKTTIRARPAPKIASPAPRPAPQPYSPPVSSNSSGQYSYSGGGGGGGGGRPSNPPQARMGNIQASGRGPSQAERRQAAAERRREAAKADKKKTGEYKSFLAGDETFQSQISSLQKELEDYILANKGQRGDVKQDFSLALERMGAERTKALDDMKNDFAARGLLESSEYLDAVGDYDTQYQTGLGDLSRDKDRNLEDLLESLGMYRRTNKNERQNARAEAIRRRTEQFGGWTPGG